MSSGAGTLILGKAGGASFPDCERRLRPCDRDVFGLLGASAGGVTCGTTTGGIVREARRGFPRDRDAGTGLGGTVGLSVADGGAIERFFDVAFALSSVEPESSFLSRGSSRPPRPLPEPRPLPPLTLFIPLKAESGSPLLAHLDEGVPEPTVGRWVEAGVAMRNEKSGVGEW